VIYRSSFIIKIHLSLKSRDEFFYLINKPLFNDVLYALIAGISPKSDPNIINTETIINSLLEGAEIDIYNAYLDSKIGPSMDSRPY
jgi:hypothetical protein